MKAALALDCEYNKVKEYLDGHIENEQFALLLIDVLGYILSDRGDEDDKRFEDKINIEATLSGVGELMRQTYRECKAIKAEFSLLEKRLIDRVVHLQAFINVVAWKSRKDIC
jgi:hypothetical protein